MIMCHDCYTDLCSSSCWIASKLPSPSRSNSSAAASSADLLASRTRLTARANASSEDPAAAWLAPAPWHHSLNHRAPTYSHKRFFNRECVKVAAAIAIQTDRIPTCSHKCSFNKGCVKVAAATMLQIGHCDCCQVHCQVKIVQPGRNVHGHDSCTPADTSCSAHAVPSSSRQAEGPTEWQKKGLNQCAMVMEPSIAIQRNMQR